MKPVTDPHVPQAREPGLFLLNSLTVGGSEKKVVRLANAFSARGWPMHIAYLNAPDHLRDEIDAGVRVLALHRTGRFSPAAALRLAAYLRVNGVRRVIAVNLHPLVYAYAACRLRGHGAGYIALVNTSSHRSVRERRYMALYAPLLRRAVRVVFGSRSQRRDWIRTHDLRPECCLCIHNGTDTTYFNPRGNALEPRLWRERAGIPPGRFVVGTVGVMRPEKAQGDLLAAAGMLRRSGVPVSVLLVGDGPCRRELVRRAHREGLSGRTHLMGYEEDVRPMLHAMDVFVLPSRAVETFSNAGLEAMACGRCVVLSDTGGAREMVVHGTSGFIYPAGDAAGLARLLVRLHADPGLRLRVAAAGRRRVERLFSLGRMLEAYQQSVIADPDGTGMGKRRSAGSGRRGVDGDGDGACD